MLDSSITLSYSEDGVAPASDHVFNKRAHETLTAQYRHSAVIADNSLPKHRIDYTVKEPVQTAAFYGTRRSYINLRRELSVPLPTGVEAIKPVVIKVETSIPVGVSGAMVDSILEEFQALISHDITERNIKMQEC